MRIYLTIGIIQTLILVYWHHKVMYQEWRMRSNKNTVLIGALFLWFLWMVAVWPIILVKALVNED